MNNIDEELIEAAKENNPLEVRRLLSAGANIEAKNNNGNTPLHWACSHGHVQVFKELVEHGADIEAQSSEGWTALHIAALMDHLAVVNELLSPNDSNGTATTILGKRKSRGANIETKDYRGDTPLHNASCKGHLAIVQALLAVGANILAANNQGQLPIHRAISRGHSAVIKCLLKKFYSTSCQLPIHDLLEDLTCIANPNGSGAPPLQNVLGTDDVVEILEYLVGQNLALLSSCDQDGSLPLHVACRRGASFTIVQSLVNLYKASVKCLTPQGDLPLFLACEMPEPSLDTIFILVKLYPDLVYR
jgi:ankyrin repeat protein